MKIKVILKIAVIFGLFGILFGCTKPALSNKVRVVLDWTPNTNHTGLYVAKNLGYYKDAGLDIEIIQPPEDGAMTLLAAGKAEFGVDFQDSFAMALTAGEPLPLTAIGAIVNHNTSGIISPVEKGITSPKMLEGKRFSAWSMPVTDAIMRSVVEADGGNITKVTMLPNAVTDVVSALRADIDAVWIFRGWDGVAVDMSGLAYNYLAFADLNPAFDFYTPILVAENHYIADNPERVKAFLSATAKGYRYASENPEQAAQILVEEVPELELEMILQSQRYLSPQYKSDAPYWGYIDQARWQAFYDWMWDQGLIEQPIGKNGFTNEYLDQKVFS